MRFIDTPELATWRRTVRAFIKQHWPADWDLGWIEEAEHSSEPALRERREAVVKPWFDRLAANGWIAPAWPKEYGGAGLGVIEQFVLAQELTEAGAPPSRRALNLLGPTLLLHGTPEQKSTYLPPMLRGEVTWCQGFSEPGAGSDLASLQTRAVRDGDDYVVNGQKIWTSGAHEADYNLALVRTDPDAPKHRGISYLMIDMRSPGISFRPLVNMAGLHNFNETFFDDVRVPVGNRIGEENRGWYVATTTLDFERSNISRATECRKHVERTVRYVQDRQRLGEQVRPEHRAEIADRALEAVIAQLLCTVVVSIQARGGVPNMEASMSKMFGTELLQRIARTQVKVAAMGGQLRSPDALAARHALKPGLHYVMTSALSIVAGTSEIQRNIIAERGLGLPRG